MGDQSPGRLDCLFDPCMLGFCTTNPPGQLGMVGSIGFCNDIAVSSSSPLPAPHGMQCGSNPRQVCQAGACTVVPCTSNTDCGQGERCDAPAIPCTSTMVIAVGSCQGPYYSFKCVPGP